MKKIISLLSALTLMATMAVSVNAETKPTVKLEVSSTGTTAGSVVTLTCKYENFDVTPYDDVNTGEGQVLTSAQIRIDVPGGFGTAAQGEQFLRPGLTMTSGAKTGSFTPNVDMVNNQLTGVLSGASDPMSSNGVLFTATLTLNKDVTEDLEFTFNADYDTKVIYDNYSEWTMGDTVKVDKTALDLVTATLKAPVVEPEEPEITINNKYVFNFTADAGEEVMVKLTRTNGIESDLTYSLPELVKGEASIFGLLKVTDDTVVSGDKFDISVVDANRNPVKAITTITVD